VPPVTAAASDVTVIVPVRDRADGLLHCLTALGRDRPVIVVDDASRDPAAVAQVAAEHGAKLIRREVNGGPAGARNTGLAAATSDLVAFVDSDCEPSPGWITRLSAHFADPLVAVAAPRITGRAARTAAGRYTEANGPLDLGGRPGRVRPGSAISYVPTAAVLARREALLGVARDGRVFDESLRVGEDVDLIWRLHEAGWRIRYDPSVQATHHEPASWVELLARRYRYGTSAAPLARRHPGAVVHLVLQPWPALTVAALLARRPVVAAVAFAGGLTATGERLRRAQVPRAGLTKATVTATRQTWLGLGRYATQFAAPLLVLGITAPGRATARGGAGMAGVAGVAGGEGGSGRVRRGRWGRRAALASLLLGPPLTAWAEGSRAQDPASFTIARIADDIAYGLGVWSGCVAGRTLAPLRPVISWHPLRIDPACTAAKPAKECPS
jgi:mycofactocin glycosyltransferase